MNITIQGTCVTHRAAFEPIRTVHTYVIGWATVGTFRFPAIIHAPSGWVVTVSDWQAPYAEIDLSEPIQIRDLLRSGSGTFMVPKSRAPSIVAKHFAS